MHFTYIFNPNIFKKMSNNNNNIRIIYKSILKYIYKICFLIVNNKACKLKKKILKTLLLILKLD